MANRRVIEEKGFKDTASIIDYMNFGVKMVLKNRISTHRLCVPMR